MKPLILSVLFLAGALLAARPECLGDTGPVKAANAFEVDEIKNLSYNPAPNADAKGHLLDLYLPKGHKDFPVMMWVYGGAWVSGDKDKYPKLSRLFARHGIGVAAINYRLAQHKHPEQVQDVARAFAWLHANVGKYGGRNDLLFPTGHSAGGHLVALLATDEKYLKAEKLSLSHIKGVIPVSGVFDLPEKTPGKMFPNAFGEDRTKWADAAPLHHVKANHPPFLILYGSGDVKPMRTLAEEMAKALEAVKCSAEAHEINDHNHIQMVMQMSNEDDPTTQAILKFITRLATAKPANEGTNKAP